MSETVLFQIIQFNVRAQFKCQKQFYFKQFSLAHVKFFLYTKLNIKIVLFNQFSLSLVKFKCHTLLFDPQIGPYQVLPLLVRVYLRVMEIKGYSAFLKAPALLEPHYQVFLYHNQDTRWESLTPL